MRFVNRNAYVVCAISGRNFCSSAQEAFSLLLRNAVRVVVLDKVTDFLLFLGRMVIVSAVGIASFYVFTGHFDALNKHLPPTNYYMVPVITTTLGAYFIAGLFFSVYSMAIDTIFLCFRKLAFLFNHLIIDFNKGHMLDLQFKIPRRMTGQPINPITCQKT